MKRILLFFFFLATASRVSGQNEFAAAAFYIEFRKVYADGQAGFPEHKGDKRKSEYEELADEYRLKTLLPLADSGKLVVPASGTAPYVIYYFEPDKMRLKVDQRGMNLRDAILIAFEGSLYTRTETLMVNNYPLTTAYYFADASESRNSLALFKMTIYYREGKYYLSLEVRGKNP